MNMFGLEGSGFIVAIGVTLLISGAIVYYCNSRISSLEKAVVQQNQVLGDFITNVRASITMGGGSNQPPVASNDHANELAVDAANAFYSGTTPENRIEVSDDDDDEGAALNDNKANLVKKTATSDEAVTMNALQPGFLDAFKGHVKHSTTTTVDFGAAGGLTSSDHGIADDAVVDEVRIPLLVKFTVA